jgi:hypothetical protein
VLDMTEGKLNKHPKYGEPTFCFLTSMYKCAACNFWPVYTSAAIPEKQRRGLYGLHNVFA